MITRRHFTAAASAFAIGRPRAASRPNILFAISDDQSWLHTSAMGDPVVRTPAFDRVANAGVLFRNGFCGAPQCAPSRAALLTGRPIWTLEEAGTHASLFPKKFDVYPDLLEAAGYFVGLTGKGAGPCNWRDSGWRRNPAGPSFDSRRGSGVLEGVNSNDYASNFGDFLRQRPNGKPFCFFFGCHEPHRTYKRGSGAASGKDLSKIVVPPFLPDVPEVRSDLADYLTEIEHFDRHLGRILDQIRRAGELENTLIVVTSDNGMAFPHAKAAMHDYGWHVPLAMAWPGRFAGRRTLDDLAGFVDLAPTFLEAAGLAVPATMTGRSLLPTLDSGKNGMVDPKRDRVYSGRERHSHARRDNLGYPARAVRTREHLYIRNFKPDRWPAGDPGGYHDIDNGPTKSYMIEHKSDPHVAALFEKGFGKHPAEELYDLKSDPGCLKNLAGAPEYKKVQQSLAADLDRVLKAQRDPRVMGTGDIWDSYPRFSPMRPELGGFAEQGKYNPQFAPGGAKGK
jgi:uncharacterized sulfatase